MKLHSVTVLNPEVRRNIHRLMSCIVTTYQTHMHWEWELNPYHLGQKSIYPSQTPGKVHFLQFNFKCTKIGSRVRDDMGTPHTNIFTFSINGKQQHIYTYVLEFYFSYVEQLFLNVLSAQTNRRLWPFLVVFFFDSSELHIPESYGIIRPCSTDFNGNMRTNPKAS